MRVARVAAQAKINLFLRVGSRRADGFHDVVTMFQLVDLADDVIVRIGGAGRTLHVAGPRLPDAGLGPTEKNLAYRAAIAYLERAGWPNGFSIELNKNIPAGGGLGGGSSDAGAVLRALDAANERPIGPAALDVLAAQLGSDVPFFVSGSARALAMGRGEMLGGLDPLFARDVLLVVPQFGVATADAYRWLDEDRTSGYPDVTPAPESAPDPAGSAVTAATPPPGSDEWDLVERASHNDFEPVVERRHPELRRIREALSGHRASIARLSGSGSTVFGVFDRLPAMPATIGGDLVVLRTRTSSRVVPVEVLE
jgi:4-diphosphocytidyl-2-C-methyl-D-erythritol kinase